MTQPTGHFCQFVGLSSLVDFLLGHLAVEQRVTSSSEHQRKVTSIPSEPIIRSLEPKETKCHQTQVERPEGMGVSWLAAPKRRPMLRLMRVSGRH